MGPCAPGKIDTERRQPVAVAPRTAAANQILAQQSFNITKPLADKVLLGDNCGFMANVPSTNCGRQKGRA